MKFTCNTKPLNDALALGIVNSNVSKYYAKSNLAQITATKTKVTINLEASYIVSELALKGMGDTDETVTTFVDSLLFKQLVSTFETTTITLEFVAGGLILHSGKSKFTLPQMMESGELELRKPSSVEGLVATDVARDDWKFIKDNQMFAISMSFEQPVYTRVWVGESGDVLVCDLTDGVVTHSRRSKLQATCLLSDTVINLLSSLPEGAKIRQNDRNYIVTVTTDSFSYTSEFTPQYEDDPDVGSYHSEIILPSTIEPKEVITVSAPALNKFMGQASLLSSGTEAQIEMSVEGKQLTLKDDNVDCKVDIESGDVEPFAVSFKTSYLASIISNFGNAKLHISPRVRDDKVVGVGFWTSDLGAVLAAVEDEA